MRFTTTDLTPRGFSLMSRARLWLSLAAITVEEEERMGKRKIARRAQAAAAALLLMTMAGPARGEVAVTAKGGTLGAGVELTVGIGTGQGGKLPV